ncbi:hypothetical protein [Actinomadura hibisca]|uniref:hypothetical protein n=1 Tax=Actinomadura hibisca TaxID=68565 RepID=UPI0012F9BEE3|nr:hypothetical protein [Actinomadura hibisca]
MDRLVPGVSTVTRFVRYYAMYAALAAHAGRHELDAAACRALVRRCEVIMAGASLLLDDPSLAHGIDRVRPHLGDHLDVAAAAEDYSPRAWGFWEQYGGPGTLLGTVAVEERALRPGRHSCPAPVRDLFAPLIEAASHDRLTWDQIEALEPLTLTAQEQPEGPWLRDLFTATRNGSHDPDAWETDDRRRRGALRIVGRATVLDGHSDEDAVRSVVAFGNRAATDPVLAAIPEVMDWRGVLLRHYSVGAWRRLWATLVSAIDDSGPQELRDWLAGQMPDQTVRAFMNELPDTMAGGHPAPIERAALAMGDPHDPLTNVHLLLLGGRRSGELDGDTKTAFLGPRSALNPEWVRLRTQDLSGRTMRDLAAGLVDDMLAQSRRVALDKMTPDGTGRLKVFSRVHERNGRYYKTGDEGAGDLGLRLDRLAEFAFQLGLIDLAGDDGATKVSPLGARLLEVGA